MEAATVATALGDVDRSGRWLLLISLALIGMVFVLVRRGAFVAAALAAAGALYLRCGFLLKCAGPALLVEAVRPDGWAESLSTPHHGAPEPAERRMVPAAPPRDPWAA